MDQIINQMKLQSESWKGRVAKHRMFAAILCFMGPILVFTPAAPSIPDSSETSPPAGVTIQTEATPEVAAIGDAIQINVEIETPPGYRVELIEPESQTGDFTILDFFPGPTLPETEQNDTSQSAETSHHHRARIIAAVYEVGTFVFPSVPVLVTTSEGEEISLSSPPVTIEIKSILSEENPALKDLKRQAEIPEPVRWWIWIIAALAAGILAILIRYYLRKRPDVPAPQTPEEMMDLLALAEADLKALLARGFPGNGKVKHFYVLLSEIVKRILESGYTIQTAERTTGEIMDSLNRRPGQESENIQCIESFLTRCDVVKFAKYIPSQVEHETVAKDALRILD